MYFLKLYEKLELKTQNIYKNLIVISLMNKNTLYTDNYKSYLKPKISLAYKNIFFHVTIFIFFLIIFLYIFKIHILISLVFGILATFIIRLIPGKKD